MEAVWTFRKKSKLAIHFEEKKRASFGFSKRREQSGNMGVGKLL